MQFEADCPHCGEKEIQIEPVSKPSTLNEDEDTRLLSFDEIPSWYQDNEFIRRGYRPVSESAKACLRSWFCLHNELVNIHSHLLPAAVFLLAEAFILELLHHRYKAGLTAGDYIVLAFFLLTATTCFGLSAAYHTLISHSHKVESLWLRLDFAGIILLIVGSFVSGIHVGFWCENLQRTIYWGMSGGLGALSLFVMLHPTFQGLKWRTFRLLCLVFTGFSGLAPIAHGIHKFGFHQWMLQSGLPYYLAEGGVYLSGAVVYATRFPECLKPGKFDIWGSSHQIFHVLVVFATAIHLVGVMTAFDYNYHNRQCTLH